MWTICLRLSILRSLKRRGDSIQGGRGGVIRYSKILVFVCLFEELTGFSANTHMY
jgi:hypothetical protein